MISEEAIKNDVKESGCGLIWWQYPGRQSSGTWNPWRYLWNQRTHRARTVDILVEFQISHCPNTIIPFTLALDTNRTSLSYYICKDRFFFIYFTAAWQFWKMLTLPYYLTANASAKAASFLRSHSQYTFCLHTSSWLPTFSVIHLISLDFPSSLIAPFFCRLPSSS
jgi:hypothetical protein